MSVTRRSAVALLAGAGAGSALAPPAKAQSTELTFWSWRQEDRAAYQRFIADFQKGNPGVSVKFEAFEPQNYQTILSTALAGGKGPDVMQVRAYGNLESIAKAGYLMPLDPAKVPELANLPESALKAESVRGEPAVYAVPFASQTMLIVYNTELFAANGVKPPETWDELIELCKALKAKNITPFANGVATAWQNETIVSALLSSMIGKSFEADLVAGKADFTDARFVNALKKLDEIKQYFAPNFTGVDYASAQQLFVAGRAAMFAGGSFELANFAKQNPRLKMDVFAPPAAQTGGERLVGLYYDGGYAINAKTEKSDAALKFIRYLATPQFGTAFSNTLQNVSPIKGVQAEDPQVAKVSQMNSNAISYLMLVHFRYQEPSGSVLLQQGVQKMMAGQATPEQVAADVTKGIATYHAPFRK